MTSELCEELEVQISVHQESVLSLKFFAMVVDEIAENAREGLMDEILCADDFVLIVKLLKI